MSWGNLLIILLLLVYLAIGSFVSGLIGDTDKGKPNALVTFFWPVLVVFFIVVLAPIGFFGWVYECGQNIQKGSGK